MEDFVKNMKEISAVNDTYSAFLAITTPAFRKQILQKLDSLLLLDQGYLAGKTLIVVGLGQAGEALAALYAQYNETTLKFVSKVGKRWMLFGGDEHVDRKLTHTELPDKLIPCKLFVGSVSGDGVEADAAAALKKIGYEVTGIFALFNLCQVTKTNSVPIEEVIEKRTGAKLYSCVTIQELEPEETEEEVDADAAEQE